MEKIKRLITMGGGKATLACLVLIVITLAFTGCEQPNNTVHDYIINGDTWEIYTTKGLLEWNNYVTSSVSYLETNATLMADISLEGKSWTPVGFYSSSYHFYTGTFDGNGHTISNLTIDLPNNENVGLFGFFDGMVKDLTLSDVEIYGNKYVGGIAAYNVGKIENCSVSGNVTGLGENVGGIAGENYNGTITACYNTGRVTGLSFVGGIAGCNSCLVGKATILACYNTGRVIGSSSVGGIAGSNINGDTKACYNTGKIIGIGSVGAILGQNNSTVEACYWTESKGSSADSGIGNEQESDDTTKVDGSKAAWDDAKLAMNDALDGYNYKYKENTDSTTKDTMPLIIVKSSN